MAELEVRPYVHKRSHPNCRTSGPNFSSANYSDHTYFVASIGKPFSTQSAAKLVVSRSR